MKYSEYSKPYDCLNINECEAGHDCDANALCQDTEGKSSKCQKFEQYKYVLYACE